MRFSERNGYQPIRGIIQKESINTNLKNSLWNTISECIFNEYSRPLQLAIPEDVTSEYYFSILTKDTSGKMLRIAEIFHSEGISFKQILQKGTKDDTARLVIVTHAMNKTQLEQVTRKLAEATDFTLVNTFKVLGE